MWEGAAKTGVAPSQSAIARVRGIISPTTLRTESPSSLGKGDPRVRIETGGIGKGYAVDAMRDYLKSQGVRHAFINFGRSSIAAIGTPPGATGWKMELALTEASPEGTIELRDETLSVSRSKGTPFVVGGVEYAHIFDPRSGAPVKAARGAAVRGPSATDGEAFVKYLVIRGAPSARISRQWGDVEWMVKSGKTVALSKGFDVGHAQSEEPVSRRAGSRE
jgi:thiamine biosynthesis lipoprotein